MTKTHFIALASALYDAKPIMHKDTDYYRGWFNCVMRVATVCAQSSPNFNCSKFLTACGIED